MSGELTKPPSGILGVIAHVRSLDTGFDFTTVEDDDVAINTVRQVRFAMLEQQLERGIPTDKDSFEQLHKNLQAIESGAIQRKRIIVEDEANNTNGALARQIMQSIFENAGKRDLFVSEQGPVAEIPDPLAAIEGTATIIDGELEVGVVDMNYEDFMATKGRAIDERRSAGEITLSDFL